MTLEQLKYCIEAAKHRSFSQAAEALYVSQSNISMSISNLENELGLQLFRRTSKGVIPTVHGNVVLECTQELFKQLNNINIYADNHRDSLEAEVKIGSAALFSTSMLKDLLIDIISYCPEIKLKSETLTNREIIDYIYLQRLQYGLLGYKASQEHDLIVELETKQIDYIPLY